MFQLCIALLRDQLEIPRDDQCKYIGILWLVLNCDNDMKRQMRKFYVNINILSRNSMCSLAVSTQDSPAVEPRSNHGSGKILMSENLMLNTTSPVVIC